MAIYLDGINIRLTVAHTTNLIDKLKISARLEPPVPFYPVPEPAL